jgi:two-component system, chemotaxis family, protein-glutamate methylesterase/glutaminase
VLPETPMAVERIGVREPSPTEGRDLRPTPGRRYDVVLVAASAGGLAAISAVLGAIPADFPVPIVIVQHLDPRHASLMAEILRRRTSLQVEEAREGTRVKPSTVYIAPPNEHLLVRADGRLILSHADPVHFVRPSADLLFESAAESFPGRAIGVVLTGTGRDSNMGVRAIRAAGGTVIAQDPTSAEFAGMPQAAIDTGGVDFVLRLEEVGPALVELVQQHGGIGDEDEVSR